MSYSNAWRSGTAVLVALGLTTGSVAPIITAAPAFAQTTSFSDVSSNYWASGFIQELVQRDVIAGFPDGTFRPEEPVTRAQFAAMINKAFNKSPVRQSANFADVSSSYWAASAIQKAYTIGFMSGYPGNIFRPDENIPRAQVLVSLANGLNYAASGDAENVLLAYNDASSIPGYARPSIAAATERRIVVNYPDTKELNPNQRATRAEVAAFIYQALVSTGQVAAVSSPYIVGQAPSQPQQVRIPAGTTIPIRYEQAERILLSKDEPKPSPITAKVAQNIVTSSGQVLIPAGSDVVGELRVADGAAQFYANEIVLPNGQRLAVNATSNKITKTETISKGISVGRIVTGTAVGAGAAAAISAVTGDRNIQAWEVLSGAAGGAILGTIFGRDKAELLTIDPDTDLNLTLNSDLAIR